MIMIVHLDYEETKQALERGFGKLFREPIKVTDYQGINSYASSLKCGIAVTIETNAPTNANPYRGEPNVG